MGCAQSKQKKGDAPEGQNFVLREVTHWTRWFLPQEQRAEVPVLTQEEISVPEAIVPQSSSTPACSVEQPSTAELPLEDSVSSPAVAPCHIEDVDVELQETATTASQPASLYNLQGPSVKGEVSELWAKYVYKIVNDDGWFFYSDAPLYEITYTFKTSSDLAAGEGTKKTTTDGKNAYTVTLYPGETRHLWRGEPNGWACSASAAGLSDEYCTKIAKAALAVTQAEIDAVEKIWKSLPAAERVNPESLLKACVQQKIKFVDLSYKPLKASLGPMGLNCSWLRPSSFLPASEQSKVKLIRDGVEPNDIDQGRLGDCWFLCAIAAVAEDAEKVKDIFRHPQRDPDIIRAERDVGAYRVTLNKHGWWEHLILDNFLPCVGSTPCFARNADDPAELWVSLLEKAYARLHNGYGHIVGGDALQALADLTGYPTMRFPPLTEDPDGIFAKVLKYDEAGYMLNVNTPGEDDSAYMSKTTTANTTDFTARYKAAGLAMGHAYTILQAKHFQAEQVKLVQIRNPWGNSTEWTGDWGDHSTKWDEHLAIRDACNHAKAEDGTFWMAWGDAIQFFESGGVCFVERNWFDYRIKNSFDKAAITEVVLEVTVTKPTTMYIVLSQTDRRGLPENDPNRDYHAVMISVCEKVEDQYVASRNSFWKDLDEPSPDYSYCRGREIATKVTLQPQADPYLIVPRAHPSCTTTKAFVLGIISDVAAGNGMSARFVKPASDWKCYQNYSKFGYVPSAVPEVSSQFQFNPEVGCPVTVSGTKLRDSE
jgi:hypothetical protein